ncbi:ABC transporter substrate-binding protein [Actinocorallia sp. API 0066]|uniref:ABC transporter substrate-binding protein n=1 Tax=Actinocorallia sp. API 0066 TaxID=2896846 RepID=UPI001E30D819|nr:ABC transporter substrate-binding protein [Actinocorallia sp. API 0066]MCD0453460.1 ABC transporter substrate-binding protein [Actinocorallia sp. API 0066]
MVSRPTALLALSALTLTAAACGTGGGDADASGDVVKIGALLSMSGVYATLGPAERNAITMGVEELNKTGFTVNGEKHTFEVVFADDKSDAATGSSRRPGSPSRRAS